MKHYLLSNDNEDFLVKANSVIEAVYLLAKSRFDEEAYEDIIFNDNPINTSHEAIAETHMEFEMGFILNEYKIKEVNVDDVDSTSLHSFITVDEITDYQNKYIGDNFEIPDKLKEMAYELEEV